MDDLKREINLAELLPPVSRESADMQEIMRIESFEFQDLWETMVDIFYNQYIVTMTDYGLRQWESMLDIQPEATASLDTRRQTILQILMGQRPFTMKSFQKMLNTAFGEGSVNLELIHDKYELWFNLSANAVYKRNDIFTFSDRIVPENLLIFFKNIIEGELNQFIGGIVSVQSVVNIEADTSFILKMDIAINISAIISIANKIIEI